MNGQVRAENVAGMVLSHIARAGDDGVTLMELVDLTGLDYRVLHKVRWVLEGSPEPSRSSPKYGVPRHPDRIRARRLKSSDRTVRYVALSTPAADVIPRTNAPVGIDGSPHLASGSDPGGQVAPDGQTPSNVRFLVNAAGDIYGRELDDGAVEDVDPESWGWASPGHRTPPEAATRSTSWLRCLASQ